MWAAITVLRGWDGVGRSVGLRGEEQCGHSCGMLQVGWAACAAVMGGGEVHGGSWAESWGLPFVLLTQRAGCFVFCLGQAGQAGPRLGSPGAADPEGGGLFCRAALRCQWDIPCTNCFRSSTPSGVCFCGFLSFKLRSEPFPSGSEKSEQPGDSLQAVRGNLFNKGAAFIGAVQCISLSLQVGGWRGCEQCCQTP